jgi:putative iron-dependent peroxidase
VDEQHMPPSSHVDRATIERDGVEQDVFGRNVAYGGVTDHGTAFVGFSAEQGRLTEMLERMAGIPDGVRDELTRYVTALTGGCYPVPAVEALARFAPPEED